MNKNQIITIRYTKIDHTNPSPFMNDCIMPCTGQVPVGEAIDALSHIVQSSNEYTVKHNGALIVSLAVTDYSLIAYGDNGESYRVDSVEKLTEFLHGLVVTKLLKNPDSDLMSMYPISLEMWL